MNTEQFWALNADLPAEDAAEVILDRLVALSPDDIIRYQAIFDRYFAEAYRWDLWGAAYLIDGGCSDDGFMDFRYGLISKGRAIYEAALENPESLADVASDSDAGYIPNEDFGHAATQAYETVTGHGMPDRTYDHPQEPAGEEWDFDDEALCKQRLPKLWAKFGG